MAVQLQLKYLKECFTVLRCCSSFQIEDVKRAVDNSTVIRCYSSEEAKLISRAISKLSFTPLSMTLLCLICLSLISPPVVIATYCKRVIACKLCNDLWTSRMCPYCRTNEYQVVESTCFDYILIRMKEMAQDDKDLQINDTFKKTSKQTNL